MVINTEGVGGLRSGYSASQNCHHTSVVWGYISEGSLRVQIRVLFQGIYQMELKDKYQSIV